MPWQQLHFTVKADDVDFISELLFAADALSVSCRDLHDDAIFEPENGTLLWPETYVTGLFPMGCAINTILQQIALGLAPQPLPPHHADILEDAVWERIWLTDFKPLCINQRLWICPSNSDKPQDNKPVLWLDPGLAFGTGTHATTALCLEALTTLVLQDKIIMDYGCGSGILALAALKLGAKKAYGIDNHEQALLASRNNALKNALPNEDFIISAPEACSDVQCDILVANILLKPLINLASVFTTYLSSGKILLLSGILTGQVPTLLPHYTTDFILQESKECDNWVLLILTRR